MTEDEIIVQLVGETDSFLADILEKYSLDPLSLSSLMLARLMRINQEVGTVDTFRELLLDVHKKQLPIIANQSESVH